MKAISTPALSRRRIVPETREKRLESQGLSGRKVSEPADRACWSARGKKDRAGGKINLTGRERKAPYFVGKTCH